MHLNSCKLAFHRAIFILFFQFVGHLTVEWVNYFFIISIWRSTVKLYELSTLYLFRLNSLIIS